MNLNHLKTFHHFCRFMSVSRTAEYLHVTQPAVSQQLKLFQEECGSPLFYKTANTFRLTETGETVFLLSKVVFNRIDQMKKLLEKNKPGTSVLRIGVPRAYAGVGMPDLIGKFQERYPHVHVKLSEGNSADLLNAVRSCRQDLVIVARSEYGPSLKSFPFARADVILVAKPDHPFAKRGKISVKELEGQATIIREQGSGSRNAIMHALAEHGVTPSFLVESESLGFILAYIEKNCGLSFILAHEIEEELARGVLKRIELKEGSIDLYSDIVVRRDAPISAPMNYFLGILQSYNDRFNRAPS